MHIGTQWHTFHLQCISNFRCYAVTRNNGAANLQALGSQDISFFTVFVIYQSDKCSTVWIVFNRSYSTGNVFLIAFEVDDTEHFLMSATHITHRPSTLSITAT